jgi:proteasome lid subunit RPN8/RPN11
MTDESDDAIIQFESVEQKAGLAIRPDAVAQHRVAIASARLKPGSVPLEVTLEFEALLAMKRHAMRNTNTELGGIVLGHRWISDDPVPQRGVWIRSIIEAEAYESTRASFKFTHDSWTRITEKKRAQFADHEIIGWYHTHPGWGVFLSGHDRFICDHFFPDWFQLAIVLDPIQLCWGLFERGDSKEMQIRNDLYLRSAELGLVGLEAIRETIQTSELGLFSLKDSSLARELNANRMSHDSDQSTGSLDLDHPKEMP